MSLIKPIKIWQVISFLFLSAALILANPLQAFAEQAAVPDYSFQLEQTAKNIKEHTYQDGEYLGNNALHNINKSVERVRDDLNLNEPLNQKTEKFFDEVKETTNKVFNGETRE